MNFSVANVIASSLYHRTNINCRAINDHITCLELITVSSQQANNFREFMYVYIHTHTHTHVSIEQRTQPEAWGGGYHRTGPKNLCSRKQMETKETQVTTERIYWKSILTAKECKIQL